MVRKNQPPDLGRASRQARWRSGSRRGIAGERRSSGRRRRATRRTDSGASYQDRRDKYPDSRSIPGMSGASLLGPRGRGCQLGGDRLGAWRRRAPRDRRTGAGICRPLATSAARRAAGSDLADHVARRRRYVRRSDTRPQRSRSRRDCRPLDVAILRADTRAEGVRSAGVHSTRCEPAARGADRRGNRAGA